MFLLVTHIAFPQKITITEKFTNEPLNEVLTLLSTKYNLKVAFDPIALSTVKVSGVFKNSSSNRVIATLLKNTGYEYVVINNVYVIKKSDRVVAEKNKPFQGLVRDRITGESLPYASIKVLESNVGTVTNPDGFFTLPLNNTDSIDVEVRLLGFEPIQMKIAHVKTSEGPVLIELNPTQFQLADVEVVKTVNNLVATGDHLGELILNTRSSSLPIGLSGIDVLAPLQFLPGVDGTTESLSGLLVRHSPADKNLIAYDGFTIYHIDHLLGAFSSLNSKAIKDIRLYRGGFDCRWGGRASSVVEITGKTGNENAISVDAGSDQLAGDITLEGPIGRHASFIISARRSYADFYQSALFTNLYESATSDLVLGRSKFSIYGSSANAPDYLFYDANAKISLKPSARDVISATGYIGSDYQKVTKSDISPFVNDSAKWGNRGAGFRWARQWSPKFYLNFTIGVSEFNSNFDYIDSTLKRRNSSFVFDTIIRSFGASTELNDITINLQSKLDINANANIEFGLQDNWVDVGFTDKYRHSVSGSSLIDTLRQYSFNNRLTTGWLQTSLKGSGINNFSLGLRLSHHNLTSKYYLEPRVQLILEPVNKFKLKFAAGLYNQFVNRIYFTGSTVRYVWTASDGTSYPVVASKHFISGVNYSSNGLVVDVEGYIKLTDGLSFVQNVIRRTGANSITSQSKVVWVNSRAIGLDVLLRKSWQNAEGWISYSLSRVFNQSDKLNGGDEYYALDDHLHEIKLVGIYKLKHWRAVASWIYGTPKPYDELLLLTNLTLSSEYEKNSSRLTPYHRMDLGINYLANIGRSQLEIGVKIFNLYNRNNNLSRYYTLTDTPVSDYFQGNSIIAYHDIFGYGFTPTFYINLKY